ncbi:ABC transporter substrate-binding protein [Paenibacillus rhizovicinus]|uniref:ABC transporter substrate-binding protein n=1 Tax=Paenibacillus rhizovicinus TaxID=2704463 RepID=A0A6C0P7I0_9BACL|nr:ABC transporter substrate-binding protein [Paenibacillus rhizovicinus]QHW34335.1 ABC transporter substrate-binding protein [Paenibacillus rhizovicinus]
MNKRVISVVSASLMAGFLLSGCGSAGSNGEAAAGSDGEPLKIGLNPFPTYFLWYVAEEKGFFKAHGVNVKLEWFPSYSDGLSALNSGNVDANSQTLSDTLPPAGKGIKLQIPMIIDYSSGADGFVVDPSINSVEDLKGKRIATELGTVDQFFLLSVLKNHGLAEKDIKYFNMAITDAGSSFLAGKIDAAVIWEPFLSQTLSSGKGKLLFSSKETPGMLMDAIVFRKDIVDKRPEDVKNVTAAWFEAVDYLKKNPDDAIAIMAKHADISPAEFKTSLDGVKVYDLRDNVDAQKDEKDYTSVKYNGEQVGEFLKGLDFIETVPDMSKLYNPSFVNELVKENN